MRWWHLASLDAPAVAVAWSLGFAWASGVALPAWVPVLLVLGVWAVYVGDRLLDARAGVRAQELHRLHERHRFHWRHRRVLVPLAAVAACAAAWMILKLMPAQAQARDAVLAGAAVAYFTRVHTHRMEPERASRRRAPLVSKEMMVGVLFTIGCALPAWTRGAHGLLLPVTYFAALAWLNCAAIDFWESDRDARRSPIARAAMMCALAGVVLAALAWFAQPRLTALLAAGAAAALLLGMLDRLRERMRPVALRAAADLVLLTPALLLALAGRPR